jgi:hypothetical protein
MAKLRGAADSLALRIRHHDDAVHNARMPSRREAKETYDALEQARVEIVGATHMSGVAHNLYARLSDECEAEGMDRMTRKDQLPIHQALALLVRERMSGQIAPPAAQKVLDLWRGTLGRTIHRMPQIGAISDGVRLASGFGGHGLNTTAMAGDLVARGIVDSDQTWRLFAPYELVWAGGRLGSAIAQGLYWSRGLADDVKAGLSRIRERRRLAKAARQQAQEEALKLGGPVIVPVLPSPEELAAAPVPETPAEPKALPAGEPPPGAPERRRNRGKRRKR